MLSKGRADDLLNMPFQETDLLLHEAGAPPIHTQFVELNKFPARVKKRMYVVHSSKIPDEFDLRKAPTGTAGTLRLDEIQNNGSERKMARCGVSTYVNNNAVQNIDDVDLAWNNSGSEYTDSEGGMVKDEAKRNSIVSGKKSKVPLVSMRPSSNTDSWYMLNLLQAVPFLTRYVMEKAYTLSCFREIDVIRLLTAQFYLVFEVYLTHLRWKCWNRPGLRPLTKMMLLCQLLVETRYYVSSGKVHALNAK